MTYEEFMKIEGKNYDETEVEKKNVGEEIQFWYDPHFIHTYQDITTWFPSLLKRFPEIQFVYRHAVLSGQADEDMVDETLHIVVKKEGMPERILNANVWHGSKFVSPRFSASELHEDGRHDKKPLSDFQEWTLFVTEAIEEIPRYALCRFDAITPIEKLVTFEQWKQIVQKNGKEKCTIEEKDATQFSLVASPSMRFTFSHCEHITKKLEENGVSNAMMGRVTMVMDNQIARDEYRFYFLHNQQLMMMSLRIMDDEVWQGLNAEISYASDTWEPQNTYEQSDLNELKPVIIDLVKEEPNVRLYVVTSGLNEA